MRPPRCEHVEYMLLGVVGGPARDSGRGGDHVSAMCHISVSRRVIEHAIMRSRLECRSSAEAAAVRTTEAISGETHMTMRTVLTTTLCAPPPRTGSEMTGSVSLTIMFASSRVTSRRCPFLRMGLILLAYSFCFLGME